MAPEEAQMRRFCVHIDRKTPESTFGSAVVHHRTGRPHGDLAGLGVAASAVHCMQSKPEYEHRKTAEAFHSFTAIPSPGDSKHKARGAAFINKYADAAFQKGVI